MSLFSFSKGIVIASATAFLMACGGGGSPADKLMSFYEKSVSILEDNKGDLDKAAKELEAFMESVKDSARAAKEEADAQYRALEKDDPAKAKRMEEEFGKREEALKVRMEKLRAEVPNFGSHAALQDALEKAHL